MVDLPIEGHSAAVVSLPLGAEGPRPVVIATHGNYDRPEWQCEVWRGIVGNRAFILCPRGLVRADSLSRADIRFTYASNQALEQEIDAGLAALRARFPDHVDGGPPLYTGFSLGAIMGVAIASRQPARFPRLVLVEGGHDGWTPAAAKAFAAGGLRALFVCSQPWCASEAGQAAARLEKAGVATRVARSKSVGHRYDGPVAEETQRALGWVLEGDGRWGE
jgi:pimeloyl-ACP methyl ester carboxylesterase